MRSILAALVLLLSTGGCVVAPSAGDSYPSPRQRVLRAHISPSPYNVGFYVNRPAYVALFEVVPGQGTSMLYPSPGFGRADGFVFSGSRSVHRQDRIGGRYDRDMYLPALGRGLSMGPRYLFLIASERPLELAQFGGFGMGLRSSLGVHFASSSAYHVMERLAEEVLPTTAYDGSWTTDMYVDWPGVLHHSPRRDRVLVACNGYQAYVPVTHVHQVRQALCGMERYKEQPRAIPGDAPPASADSGEVTRPQRRRPLPRAEGATLRERITSSAQLEEARRREVEEIREREGRSVRGEGREMERPGRPRLEPRRASGEGSSATERPAPAQRERPTPRARPEPSRAEPSRPAPRPRAAEPASRRPAPAGKEKGSGCNPCESR